MLPRWHVAIGALLTVFLWIVAPAISWFYLLLFFLASVFIDIDHYIVAARENNNPSLFKAFNYFHKQQKIELAEHKKGIRRKGDFFLFHTVEFQAIVGILGVFFAPFFYIFIGLVVHSLLDLADMAYRDRLYRREFFFFNWLNGVSR